MSLRINLIEKDPPILEKLHRLGEMLTQPGWYGYVLCELQKIAVGDLYALPEEDQLQAKIQYYYLRGICCQGVARYSEAIGSFFSVPNWESNLVVLKNLEDCHKALGKLDMAMEMAARISDIHHKKLGDDHFKSQNYELAVRHFLQVRDWYNKDVIYQKILFAGHYVVLNKSIATFMLQHVNNALSEKRYEKAKFLLRELVTCFPDNFEICYLQCEFLKTMNAPEAKDIQEFALQRWQRYPAYFNKLQILFFGAVIERDYSHLHRPTPIRSDRLSDKHAILCNEWLDVAPADSLENYSENNPLDNSYSTLERKC